MKNVISHIRQSLSLKLSFGILLLAIPIFVVSLGILLMQSQYFIKKEATERAASVLNTTGERVAGYMQTIETATLSNDWYITEDPTPDNLLELSHRIVMLNANVDGCSITTEPYFFAEYGRYFSAYSVRKGDSIITVREAEYEYFDKVWYSSPSKLGHACWVDPFDDFNEGTLAADEMIASYCKPLYTKTGRLIGVIATDLSLRRLTEVIQAEKPYPNAYFFMLGKDGHYFVHPDSAVLVNNTIFTDRDAMQHAGIIALGHEMTTGHSGAMNVNIKGQPCLVTYQPVRGTQWSLALVCPTGDMLHSHQQLTLITLPFIIVGLLLVLLFCRSIVSHAISPLGRLLEQSQHIANGRYDEQIATTRRKDAVGQLQNSFAAMQASLCNHVSSIQHANEQSAQRVEELRNANTKVEEAARQKTAFIQNMTHQIRTPLNIIMGFAQVMRDNRRDLPPEELQGIAYMMRHNAFTLNRMVLMLYDSSDTGRSQELQNLNCEPTSCNEVARESIEHVRLHFPDLPISFHTTLPDDFCIRTNRLYLMRSLREVLYNSAKYSDGKHISLCISATGTAVRFVFQDTGPGIAEEFRYQLFTPFYKADDLSEGLGLGLPLTKRHVTNLGGNMTLDTDYHDGCRFIIEFPIVEQSTS